jgi:hypothetical protein
MNTRHKIIDCAQALSLAAELRGRGSGVKVVSGYFDVLVPDHVRRLRQIADGWHKLFVFVLDLPSPLLATRARAELVAALAMVDYVVPVAEQGVEQLLGSFGASEIIREESADLRRAERLSQHVKRRHQA